MNDDEFGALLLRPLAGEPAGPPRIDVAKAMRDGRRLRRRRWWTGGTALAAATTTAVAGGVLATATGPDKPQPDLPPDPSMPTACTVQRLPLGAHTSVEVTGGDPSGTYLVGSSDPTYGKKHAVLVWRDGKLIADVPVPDVTLTMSDINGSGVAVGGSSEGSRNPYIYRDGKVSKLRGGQGNAIAINDAGVIIGTLHKDGGPVLVRWATPDAEPQPLPADTSSSSDEVYDLAEDGAIIGQIGGLNGNGYLWLPDGSQRLITPPPVDGATAFIPNTFRNGWIYGVVRIGRADTGSSSVSYRYEPRSETWQPLPELNDPGQQPKASDALKVRVGDRLLQLPPYTPATDNGDLALAETVSADARTFAGSTVSATANPELDIAPLLWRCE
jgi:hypothetical protein